MAKKALALDGTRLRTTRELKGFKTQEAFAKAIGVDQPHVCNLEKGKLRNAEVFVRVADVLECTTDFLFRRGPYTSVESEEQFRSALSRMAFDVFAGRPDTTNERREWCRRTLGHPASPVTVKEWVNLSEQIEMAVGPKQIGPRLLRRRANFD